MNQKYHLGMFNDKIVSFLYRRSTKYLIETMILVDLLTVFLLSFSSFAGYHFLLAVFDNIGEGFWWAIITFSTVGYGDIYPITPLGKFLGGFIALIGMVTIALPTGLFTSSFMTGMRQEKIEKRIAKLGVPIVVSF